MAIAYRLLGDRHQAMDAVQQALIRLCRTLDSFDGRAAFSTWFFRIVVNVCRDELRKQASRARSMDHLTRTLSSPHATPPYVADSDRARVAAVIAEAVGALPDDEREAVVLKHYAALTFAEMAVVLETPVSTLKSRVLRGLERLRNHLRDAQCLDLESGAAT